MDTEAKIGRQDSVILEQIKSLLRDRGAWFKKERIDRYITSRLDALTKTSTSEEIPPYTGMYERFIHPDSPMSVSKRLIRFRLDDPTIYHELISRMHQFLVGGGGV